MFNNLKPHYKGYLLASSGALSAALFFIPYKKGLETVTPEVYILAVYIFGFIFNFFGRVVKKEEHKFNLSTIWGAVAFGFLAILGNVAIGKALIGLEPSVTVVILRMQILYVMFLGWLMLKERLDTFLIPGAILAILGFAWMNYDADGYISYQWHFYLWALLAAICFGSSQIIIKSVVHRVNPIAMNHLRFLIGIIVLSFFPGILSSLFQLTGIEWLLAGISALSGPILSRTLQMYALRYVQVSQSILFSMLTPIFTLLLSFIFLGDLPSLQKIAGAIMIISGVVIPITHLIIKNHSPISIDE